MDTPFTPWITDQLDRLGERVEQIEPVRSGPASALFAVLTNDHRYYFKSCGELYAHEPALAAALDSWVPGSVPRVLATDTARHWLLMADAGPMLRARIQADGDTARSDEMLRRFAGLQQQMIPHQEELLRLRVPDRRLHRLPALYDDLIADAPALLVGQVEGVSAADLERLRAFAPTVRQLCAQLADFDLPETIQHDDFHTANVTEDYRFFDWGECYVAHPFYSLLIALRDAKFTLGYDAATLDRLRDVYLQCWTDYAPLVRLREALAITHRLAALGRALSWWQAIQHGDDAYRAASADAVPYWLLTFLHNTPLE